MIRVKTFFQRIFLMKPFSLAFRPQELNHLVLVTDHWKDCPDSMDKKLCEILHQRNFYPSTNKVIYGIPTNVALIPYKLAFVKACSPQKQERIKRTLQKKGWSVYFYTSESVSDGDASWLKNITTHSAHTKNAYLQT
ncbi:hypothetical protein [Alkalicoccobacillus porphyridii]|uniref:Uncharacterized protein n=1 Tax=Alkalicoccobacillus porphyridii TaxID=2597270 RepID=A0A553ZY39_9BACI|nr:hypothetical protein [Alkalicoccobacillus porphyridii]TSB46276.1 hypothetical protein FN960_13030 [Alkalicoccobacillus porphyridii]